ncbi:MAG: Uma2 family endonuclease [Polyangiaceae bacterium]|nr:Uma2 family endonuclease [Polyangiaceae bacterium]
MAPKYIAAARGIWKSIPTMLHFAVMHNEREMHRRANRLPKNWSDWDLFEGKRPQSTGHGAAIKLMRDILEYWARSQPNTHVAYDLGINWMKDYPKVGLDPDISVFRQALPPNPHAANVYTWEPGCSPPILAIEIVDTIEILESLSEDTPPKDYESMPDKYAESGTQELCIFDQFLDRPHGACGEYKDGPHRLQLWQRDERGDFNRVYAGDGPVYSRALNGYFRVVDNGRKLRISNDEVDLRWSTETEVLRAANEKAMVRIAELEARIAELTKVPR